MHRAVLRGAVLVGFLALLAVLLGLLGPASVEPIDTVLGLSGLLIVVAGYELLALFRWVWRRSQPPEHHTERGAH